MNIRDALMICSALLPLLGTGAKAQDGSAGAETAIITLMTKDTVVAADGTSVQTVHIELRANNDAAAAEVSKASLSFDTTMQVVEVMDAHTLKADGKTVPVDAAAIYEQLAAGQQGLLTSYRSKIIVFPQFSAGDTAVYTAKLTTKQPFFQGQFATGEVFPHTVAYGEVRETITAPKSLPLVVENHDVQFSKRETATDIVYSWHYSAPKTAPEENTAISPLDHMPRFFVSSFKDYGELGKAYAGLAESKKAVTPKISALADQVTAGVSDRKVQAQKLYEWVSAHIRYVAIELGTGSFVPHDVDSIVANGYGDCKDHDVVLQALLKAKGIESESILINAGTSYSLTDAATFAVLDHVITYVPEFKLYMDSTAAVAPFGTLPMQEYGKPMVVASAASAAAGKMPLLESGVAKIYTKTVAVLDKDGEVSGTTTTTAGGPYATTLRTMGLGIQALGPTAASRILASMGYKDADGKFTQDSPVALTPSHTISGAFKWSGWSDALAGTTSFFLPGGLRLFGVSGDGIMGPLYHEKENPGEPTLCFSAEASEDLSLKAPADAQFEEVPKDTKVETPNLVFTAHWSLDGDTLSVHRDFTSKIDQQFCTGPVLAQTSAALKKISDNYDANISFRKPESAKVAPDNVHTAFASGMAHMRSNQIDLAIQDFSQMVALSPNDTAGYANRATLYREKKQYDKAIQDDDRVIAVRPAEPGYYYERGLDHNALRQYELAVEDFDKAISLASDNFTFFSARGEDFENLKQYTRAVADYDQVIKIRPDDAAGYSARGRAFRLSGQFPQAQADLDKAIALNPNYSIAYFNRRALYVQEEQFDRALPEFDQAIKLNSVDRFSFEMRGFVYMLKMKNESAISDESQALRLKPDDAEAFYYRARAYLNYDNFANALGDLTQAIALKPDYSQAYLFRAKAREKLGQKAEADQDIQAAIKLDPTLDLKKN